MSEHPDDLNEDDGLYGWGIYALIGAYAYSFHVTDKLLNRMTYVLIVWVATYIIAKMIIDGSFKMPVVALGQSLPKKFRLRYAFIAVWACFLIEFYFPFSSFSEEVRPIPEEEKFAIECFVEASEGALSEDIAFDIIHEMNLMKMKKNKKKAGSTILTTIFMTITMSDNFPSFACALYERMTMNERIAKCLLQEAIKKLYEQDSELFDDIDKIYERAIAFRLAHHLASIIEERKCCGNGITVDCEYERHNLDKKRCFVPCNSCESGCSVAKRIKENKVLPKTMRPDIIVHRRRSNERNLLAIEIKTSLNPQRNPDSRDAAKLAYMTCAQTEKAGNPKEFYHYNIGIALNLAKEKSGCWIFKDGEQDGRRHDLT